MNEHTTGNATSATANPFAPGIQISTWHDAYIENTIRPISIKQLSIGYVVEIGCKSFAISTKEELTTKILEYINEPAKTEKKYSQLHTF